MTEPSASLPTTKDSVKPNACIPTEAGRLSRTLRRSCFGCTQTASDGVLRSFSWDRKVLDAIPLSPEQIELVNSELKWVPAEDKAKMKGVDGRKVPREQWYNPPEDMWIPPMYEGVEEQMNKFIKEDPVFWREKQEQHDRDFERARPAREAAATL